MPSCRGKRSTSPPRLTTVCQLSRVDPHCHTSGLMRGGKQLVIGLPAFQSTASHLLYAPEVLKEIIKSALIEYEEQARKKERRTVLRPMCRLFADFAVSAIP